MNRDEEEREREECERGEYSRALSVAITLWFRQRIFLLVY